MSRTLTITPAPFKSSRLAIPPSPGSPRSPLTLPIIHSIQTIRMRTQDASGTPPPPEPSSWLWQCHICNKVYPLATTRCIDDGHRFCAGTTTVRRNRKTGKKVIKHKACASEFDYGGWRKFGEWRRSLTEPGCRIAESPTSDPVASLARSTGKDSTRKVHSKDCWNKCDFPSECRWGKQVGLDRAPGQTPESSPVVDNISVKEPSYTPSQSQTFEEILLRLDEAHTQVKDVDQPMTSNTDIGPPTIQDLAQLASRRKRKSTGQTPSPLRSNPPSTSSSSALQDAFDGLEATIRATRGRVE